jgi:hypothetical protein
MPRASRAPLGIAVDASTVRGGEKTLAILNSATHVIINSMKRRSLEIRQFWRFAFYRISP